MEKLSSPENERSSLLLTFAQFLLQLFCLFTSFAVCLYLRFNFFNYRADSTIVGDFKMLANFGQSFVGMTPKQIYGYIPLFVSPFLETISAELGTL